MSYFQFKWLRKFIRRNTSPIPIDKAELWKRRLSLLYMTLAWQAFGLVCYMVYTGKADWAKYHGLKTDMDSHLTPGQQFARTFNIEKGKIVRISGLQKVHEIEIEPEVKEE